MNTTTLHLLEGHAPKYWFKLTRACVRAKTTRLMRVCNLLPKEAAAKIVLKDDRGVGYYDG
ncbi:hypothetical protein PILCRDRAFT_823956 [Piloderma croceum F 1598]|uniref:Uncharacterized protein n=1 Tax=Piloderma croceum (strain F 1598) TaxID=765440 RepID=A0A0C3FFV1_PILCF|nr:hypothetical protein PILCRDRAFT_823956 [Piloderma croceum F 1598]